MANDSNDNEKDSMSAEALYVRYQRNRSVDAQTNQSETDLNITADASARTDTVLAENIYKHYQATRTSDAQVSIDTIMNKINKQSIGHVILQEEQPSVSSDTPQVHAIDAQPVLVDEQTQVDTPAANSSTIFKRWLLPGVAAAVLAVVLIPTLMNTGPNPGLNPEEAQVIATMPTELSDRAAQTVAYIEAPESATFGFADTTNAAQGAFNNGVIATDLKLLVDAGESLKTQQLLRTLVAAQTSAQQGSIPDSLKDLSGKVQTSAMSMSDAISAGEGEAVINTHLATISTALEDMAGAAEQMDWFIAGSSVESIRVAAEYALENSDVKPLEQSLVLANKVAQPVTEAPASKILSELLQADLNGPEEFEIASELLNQANDIKLLMQ